MSTPFPPPSGPVSEPREEPAVPVSAPEPPLPGITLGSVHCCPYCGAPLAVVSVLMPVENPPADAA